jgi:DNA polymerase-3 subunit delta'
MTAAVLTAWGVAGHDGAVDQLRRSVKAGQIRHAMLIAGPEGIGKTALATAFLKAVSCLNPPAPGDFCGTCRACGKIHRGVHPDIQTFDLASQAATAAKSGAKNMTITIDTAREIRSAAAMRPIEGRWRAVVLDDAESMPEVAQEALLKTLEEPPPSMLLLLLVDDVEALLPTIRSRCQVIELRPVPKAATEALLLHHGAATSQATELARLAQGRPGWAMCALANPKLGEQYLHEVDQAIEWVSGGAYERLVTAVKSADRFAKARSETLSQLSVLLGVWRDLLLLGAGLNDRVTYAAFIDRLTGLGATWQLPELKRALRSVQTCIEDLETNVRPRLAMEAMVLQWPNR